VPLIKKQIDLINEINAEISRVDAAVTSDLLKCDVLWSH